MNGEDHLDTAHDLEGAEEWGIWVGADPTPFNLEHAFPAPPPSLAGKHAKHHIDFEDSSRQVTDPLARSLPSTKRTIGNTPAFKGLVLCNDSSSHNESCNDTPKQRSEPEPAEGEARADARATRRGSGFTGLSKKHNSPKEKEERKASLEFYEGASFLKVSIDRPKIKVKPPKRGEVKKFSENSRRRMMDLMAKLDNREVPHFVTLTYPDQFSQNRGKFKRDLDVLGKKVIKRWTQAFIIWKCELKVRKSGQNKGKVAPHYHLFIYGVPWKFPFKEEHGKHYKLVRSEGMEGLNYFVGWRLYVNAYEKGLFSSVFYPPSEDARPLEQRLVMDSFLDSLQNWIARNWYDIVGSGDLRHFQAGTRTEKLLNQRGAYYYASKAYMGKTEEYVEAEDLKAGRFWGIIGRKNMKLGERKVVELTPKQAFKVHRIIRKFRRANTLPEKRKYLKSDPFSAKVYCNVDEWIKKLKMVLRV